LFHLGKIVSHSRSEDYKDIKFLLGIEFDFLQKVFKQIGCRFYLLESNWIRGIDFAFTSSSFLFREREDISKRKKDKGS